MKKLLPFAILLVTLNLMAQQRPKLVVGIVVDQMKMEYLYRFQNDLSDNGFKRLMNEGFTFYNMHYNYMPTYTAPGHASIYTGTTPAVHGIVGNDWYVRDLKNTIYCTDDLTNDNKILGIADAKEKPMSPKNLQVTTITDELRLSTNFKGKVIGLSIKDRGAILPAGHFANWAFWFSKTGNFISSAFYDKNLPKWVDDFNSQKNYMKYINQGWNLLKPVADYNESLKDSNPYEGKVNGENPVFPYDLKKMYNAQGADIIKYTPYGNSLLADFAKAAIANEGLGKDDDTDFLTVSFSSTDYVGHELGPRSMELQDTYLRLDETLADFLAYLDKTVGKGNYLLFLTADHAGAENAKFLNDNKYRVINVPSETVEASMRKFSTDTYKKDFVLKYYNFNVFLDKDEIGKTKDLDILKVRQSFKEFLEKQIQVKRVYTGEEILANSGNDYYLNFIAKGYDSAEKSDLVILDKPGYIEYKETGTSHGTPYSYDTNVPCLFYGWKIPKGESHEKKAITQIAPTLAQKLMITLPNGTESQVLTEILGK